MKHFKITLAIIGSLLILSPSVWAGAGASGLLGCCVVNNPGGGASAIKGPWSLEVIPDDTALDGALVDVKTRLERAGKFDFFDLSLDENIQDLSNEEIACRILNRNEPGNLSEDTDERVTAFVNQILSTLFPDQGLNAENTALVITRGSVTYTDGPAGDPISRFPGTDNEDNTDRISSMGDIMIYAIDKGKVSYEETPYCSDEDRP